MELPYLDGPGGIAYRLWLNFLANPVSWATLTFATSIIYTILWQNVRHNVENICSK